MKLESLEYGVLGLMGRVGELLVEEVTVESLPENHENSDEKYDSLL
jgi:hypothetical protein